MRSLGFGIARIPPPFELMHIIHNGQSLSVGAMATDAGAPTQPFSNVKLFDSLGDGSGGGSPGYVVTQPQAATLSLIALTTPMKPFVPPGGAIYPGNVLGNSAEVYMANQLAQLALQGGYDGFRIYASCTGLTATAMSGINKGNLPYTAGIYEAKCAAPGAGNGNLAASIGAASYGAVGIPFTHGEQDSVNFAANNTLTPSSYQTPLTQLQSDYETDLHALFTPLSWLPHIPIVLSQCNTAPGALSGDPIVTIAMNNFADASPELCIMACAKYAFASVQVDGFHLRDYRALGEKYGQFLFKYLNEHAIAFKESRSVNPVAWMCMREFGITRVGTAVSVPLNVPILPVVIDTTTVTQPHTSGMLAAFWGTSYGFEAWDNEVVITGATNASPVVITTSTAHGQASGNVWSSEGILGNTAANGVFYVQVTGANTLKLYSDAGLTVPVAGNGAYTQGGIGREPIAISAFTISGNDVQFTLGRTPSGLTIAYAWHVDAAYNGGSGENPPRRGNLRDSDPFRGLSFSSHTPPPAGFFANWLRSFKQAVP